MNITKFKATKFRNLEPFTIELHKGVTILYGLNGQGKTNLVEGIYLLSKTNSFRTLHNKELICYDQKEATVTAKVSKSSGTHEYKVHLTTQGKICFLNKNKVAKVSEYLGGIQAISFTPEDVSIFKETPRARRWLMDSELASLFPLYMKQLILFQKLMDERNALLKVWNQNKRNLLDTIDQKLVETAYDLFKRRKWFVDSVNSLMSTIYQKITKKQEKILLVYKTFLSELDKECYIQKAKAILDANLEKDIEKTFTQNGVHKDDFMAYLEDKDVGVYASQGQQRLIALTMKLAISELVKQINQDEPIIILDDVFSELDKEKRQSLLEYILSKEQVFVTCTHYLEVIQQPLNTLIRTIKIQQGKIVERGVICNGRKQIEPL